MRTVDLRPLTDPVSAETVRVEGERLHAAGQVPGAMSRWGSAFNGLGLAVLIIVAGAFALFFAAAALVSAVLREWAAAGINAAILVAIVIGGAIAVAGNLRTRARMPERWYRLRRLAQVNRFSYWPSARSASVPGHLFPHRATSEVTDLVRMRLPRTVDVAEFSFRDGSTDDPLRTWSYIAVALDVDVPAAILTTGRSTSSTHLRVPRRDWTRSDLSPSRPGWRLHSPETSTQDEARSLFSPGIVAALDTLGRTFDAEFAGRWLLILTPGTLLGTDPAAWERLLRFLAFLEPQLPRAAR
jgi:hypothetical protein